MSEPIQLVDAEQLLAQLRAGTKETYEIKMRELSVPVRMLSLDERLEIRNRCIVQARKVGGDEAYIASITQKEILKLASSLNNGQPGVLSERLLNMLTLDEIIFLYNEYQKICEQVNPSLEQMQPEQFQLLVQAIKKNSVTPNDLSIAQLRAVFLSYQDLIQSLDSQPLPADNSFGGQS